MGKLNGCEPNMLGLAGLQNIPPTYTWFNMEADNPSMKGQIGDLLTKHLKENPEDVDFGLTLEETLKRRASVMVRNADTVRTRVCIHNTKLMAMCVVWMDHPKKRIFIDHADYVDEKNVRNLTVLLATTIHDVAREVDLYHLVIKAPEEVLKELSRVEKIKISGNEARMIVTRVYDVGSPSSTFTSKYKMDRNCDEKYARKIERSLEAGGKDIQVQRVLLGAGQPATGRLCLRSAGRKTKTARSRKSSAK